MAALLGIGGREAGILVTLGIAYAAFEGIGVSMLLPLLKYVEQGTVLLQNDRCGQRRPTIRRQRPNRRRQFPLGKRRKRKI
jgi:hypothetical protein